MIGAVIEMNTKSYKIGVTPSQDVGFMGDFLEEMTSELNFEG